METLLAILMVLGIFVGIPLVIAFTIIGMYVLGDRRAMRAERTRAVVERPAETGAGGLIRPAHS